MHQEHLTTSDRAVVREAERERKKPDIRRSRWSLPTDRIITGKTSDLLGPSAAVLLNALKELAGIPHEKHIISPTAIEPIQTLKTKYLGSKNPRLHTDEVLIALSTTAAENKDAAKALSMLAALKGCQVHSSVMLSSVDEKRCSQKLDCEVTCDPVHETVNKK